MYKKDSSTKEQTEPIEQTAKPKSLKTMEQ